MKHSLRIHLDPAKKGNLSLGFLIRWHEKEIVQLDEKPFFHLFSSSTILVGPVGGQWEGHSVQRTHMYIYIYIWVLWTYMWCLWIYHHIFFGLFMYVCNKSVWPSCMRNSLDLKLSLIKWFFGWRIFKAFILVCTLFCEYSAVSPQNWFMFAYFSLFWIYISEKLSYLPTYLPGYLPTPLENTRSK